MCRHPLLCPVSNFAALSPHPSTTTSTQPDSCRSRCSTVRFDPHTAVVRRGDKPPDSTRLQLQRFGSAPASQPPRSCRELYAERLHRKIERYRQRQFKVVLPTTRISNATLRKEAQDEHMWSMALDKESIKRLLLADMPASDTNATNNKPATASRTVQLVDDDDDDDDDNLNNDEDDDCALSEDDDTQTHRNNDNNNDNNALSEDDDTTTHNANQQQPLAESDTAKLTFRKLKRTVESFRSWTFDLDLDAIERLDLVALESNSPQQNQSQGTGFDRIEFLRTSRSLSLAAYQSFCDAGLRAST